MNNLMTKSFEDYVNLKRQAMKDLEACDIEMGNRDTEDNLAQFFHEVNVIKGSMEEISVLLTKLTLSNEESKVIYKYQAVKELRARMDQDVSSVLRNAADIKRKIEALDKENIANRKLAGCEEGSTVDRSRMAVTNGLRLRLKEMMGQFQSLRMTLVNEHKETLKRRYFTITGEHPDEETVEKIIASGESEAFLMKSIQYQGRGNIIDAIKEIQERHDATKELQKNLLDLHQIFLDMAVLVEQQGEQLDDIEHHVNHASNYVEKGTKNLHVAKQYQRNSRKWMCIAVILLLLVVFIVIIPIVTSFRKS